MRTIVCLDGQTKWKNDKKGSERERWAAGDMRWGNGKECVERRMREIEHRR